MKLSKRYATKEWVNYIASFLQSLPLDLHVYVQSMEVSKRENNVIKGEKKIKGDTGMV